MHHIFGIFLHNNNAEIMEDENPEKGSFQGLTGAMTRGRKMMKQNPKIKQINIYRIIQGQQILDYQLFAEIESNTKTS